MKLKSTLIAGLLTLGCSSPDSDPVSVSQLASTLEKPSTTSAPADTFEVIADGLLYPESTSVHGRYLCVSGPASFTIPDGEPGYLNCYDRKTGEPLVEFDLEPSVPYGPNAVSVATPGAWGDVYIVMANFLDPHIRRLNTVTHWQERFTTAFPDLPPCYLDDSVDCSVSTPCQNVPGAPPCSPELGYFAMLNSQVLDSEGNRLLVSDFLQATIWEVDLAEPAPRTPKILVTAEALEGVPQSPIPFGSNGMAIQDGHLYVANTTKGFIVRWDLSGDLTAANMEMVYAWPPIVLPDGTVLPQGPDGLKFDVDGNLWVTLAVANRISVLTEVEGAFTETQSHAPTEGVLFDEPSELVLDPLQEVGFVANHSLTNSNSDSMVLFKFGTGVKGAPLQKPVVPWPAGQTIPWGRMDFRHLSAVAWEACHQK